MGTVIVISCLVGAVWVVIADLQHIKANKQKRNNLCYIGIQKETTQSKGDSL
jgi:hypothetical protein